MNIFTLRVSFPGTLALAFLSFLVPTKLRADNTHAANSGVIKHTTGFLKTAVPEPSSFVLLGTGLVLAALALRNKGVGV